MYLYERYQSAVEMGGSRVSIQTAPTYPTSDVSVTVAAPRFRNIKYLHLDQLRSPQLIGVIFQTFQQ